MRIYTRIAQKLTEAAWLYDEDVVWYGIPSPVRFTARAIWLRKFSPMISWSKRAGRKSSHIACSIGF